MQTDTTCTTYSMRTTTSLNSSDTVVRQSSIANQELGVFLGKDIVGDSSQRVFITKALTQGQHQCSLSRTNGAN